MTSHSHPMENIEELQKTLADIVVWIRGEVICPIHGALDEVILTPEGPVTYSGPWCESIVGRTLWGECEWRLRRDEMLESAFAVLGTRDMSGFH